MTKRDLNSAFRRVLYDAMVLSSSLTEVLDCNYFDEDSSDEEGLSHAIDPLVECHHMNALVQIRSMFDFLDCNGTRQDDMRTDDFPGCGKQSSASLSGDERDSINKFAAHKSWGAIQDDESGGAQRITKEELICIGRSVLEAFILFRDQCVKHNPEIKANLNAFALRYFKEFNGNWQDLRVE